MGTPELAYTDHHVFLKKQIEEGFFKGEVNAGIFKGEVNLNQFTNNLQEYLSAKCSLISSKLKESETDLKYYEEQIQNYREYIPKINDAMNSERDNFKEIIEDKRNLTKQIDIIMFGKDSADNPSLCDVVKSVQDMKKYLDEVVSVLEDVHTISPLLGKELQKKIKETLSKNIFKDGK